MPPSNPSSPAAAAPDTPLPTAPEANEAPETKVPDVGGRDAAALSLRNENGEERDASREASAAHPSGASPMPLSASTSALAAPSEAADEESIREFYSQMVTLLTQENTPAPRKKNRNTLAATLRRHWFAALALSVLAFAGFFSLLRPRQSTYQVSVTLLLPPRTMVGTQNQDPFAPPEESYDTEAELAIIGSENIVKTAMSRLPDALKARGWGSKDVQVAPVEAVSYGSPSLISINVSSLDYLASRRLSTEMVATYIDYTRNRYNRNREENLKITRQRVDKSGRDLENARSELRRFKERSGVSGLAAPGGGATNIEALESALARERNEAIGGNGRDGGVDLLRQKALEARTEYQDTLANFFPTSERALEAEKKWRRAQAQAQAQASSDQARATSNRRIAQLQASLADARTRAARLPGIEQTLNRLNERVQLLETAYRGASDRYNQLNLARGTVAPTARVLRSPAGGSSRRGQLIRALAVSLLASLGVGVLGAWLLNRLDPTVRTIADPNDLFDVPILGVMPATGGKGIHLGGITTKRGRSAGQTATLEACYITQINMLAAARSFDSQSILITSAVPKEGKSQCACNLATAIAYGGQSVLLIDADFLHPSQHEILKMSLEPGYAHVLQGEVSPHQAIRPTEIPNLYLLSAGKNALKNPETMASLLKGPEHRRCLEELEKLYDVILIDGPPTMSMADAQLLGQMADAIVLVVAESTHQEEVYRARSMLRLGGGALLGVIVNSVNLQEIGGWDLNFSAEAPFSNYANTLRRGH